MSTHYHLNKSLSLTRPISDHTNPDALIVVSGGVCSHDVKSSSLVDPPIATNGKAVPNVIPATILLVELLHRKHCFTAFRPCQARSRLIRMVDDYVRYWSGKFFHTLRRLGVPCLSRDVGHCFEWIRKIDICYVMLSMKVWNYMLVRETEDCP